MHRIIGPSIAVASLLLAGPALGQSQRPAAGKGPADPQVCHPWSEKPISECLRIINDHSQPPGIRAKAYFLRSLRWDRTTKDGFARGLADYDQAIRLDPREPSYYLWRVEMWWGTDDNRALAECDAAIRLFPNHAPAYATRGKTWTIKGDTDRAIADFSRSLQLDSKSRDAANVFWWRAEQFRSKRDYNRAIADYDEAILIAQDFDMARQDRETVIRYRLDAAKSRYAAGRAKLQSGDAAGGDADIAAAKALVGDIADIMARESKVVPVSTPPPSPAPPAKSESAPEGASAANSDAPDCARAETHWKSAEVIGTVAVYEDHIARFVACEFVGLARAKIEVLRK